MPFRAESSSFRAYSARKPFPFHVCTMDADGSGNISERIQPENLFPFTSVQWTPTAAETSD